MTLAHLSVGKKFVLLVCAVVLGFGVFGALTYRTMNRIKVSGPLYAEIITGKDIVADILPPPEYIIESYLTAHLMSTSTDEAELRGLQKKLGALRKEYEARQTYWKDHVPEGPMGELLLKRSSTPARVFYTLVDTRLLPLVREGNTREAMALMRGDVRRAYEEHRAAIDELVTLANTHSKTSEENAAAELRFGWVLLGTAAAGMLTVVVLLNAVVARSVTIPLRSLEARLKDIAQGEGDLTKRVEIQRRDEIGLAASWFNTFVDRIERLVSEVKSGAALIGAGGTQIADASQSLAEGASEQAGSLSAISASLEKMSHQTQLSAGSAREASSLAQESKKSADRGCQEMTHMSRAVSEIKESSARISKIIHVIDEIAFQTNLLALNAAVEAARAGEAGKGFAVVAEEVRNLAQRSAAAAKDTSAMIEESVKRSDNGGADRPACRRRPGGDHQHDGQGELAAGGDRRGDERAGDGDRAGDRGGDAA